MKCPYYSKGAYCWLKQHVPPAPKKCEATACEMVLEITPPPCEVLKDK